jgi:FkbM family methyltransferase
VDFEPTIQAFYERILEDGDTAIDGGACVGRHTFPMAQAVAPSGSVLAFEPIPRFAWRLRAKLLIRYPRFARVVHIRQSALAREAGSSEFLVAEDPAYSGLRRRVYPRPDMRLTRRVVPVETLDRACASSHRLRFIKLDLEGGEFDAILGGAQVIAKHRPALAFEYDRLQTPGFYGFDHADLVRFFDQIHYRILDVRGVAFDRPAQWDDAPVWYYFALPRERRWESLVADSVAATLK